MINCKFIRGHREKIKNINEIIKLPVVQYLQNIQKKDTGLSQDLIYKQIQNQVWCLKSRPVYVSSFSLLKLLVITHEKKF